MCLFEGTHFIIVHNLPRTHTSIICNKQKYAVWLEYPPIYSDKTYILIEHFFYNSYCFGMLARHVDPSPERHNVEVNVVERVNIGFHCNTAQCNTMLCKAGHWHIIVNVYRTRMANIVANILHSQFTKNINQLRGVYCEYSRRIGLDIKLLHCGKKQSNCTTHSTGLVMASTGWSHLLSCCCELK